MLNTNKNALNIRDIGHKVATSEVFIRASNQDGTLQLTDRNRLRKAIGVAASALTGETKGGYMTAEGHAMNVTAKLTYIEIVSMNSIMAIFLFVAACALTVSKKIGGS